MAPDSGQPSSFREQFDEVRAGIEAAGNLDPYSNELLRTAYLGASALIDESDLKPVELIAYRREIAELAGKLATDKNDGTTAAEMEVRVKDCDSILKLIKPAEGEAAPQSASKPKQAPRTKKANTSASKTSGAKGSK